MFLRSIFRLFVSLALIATSLAVVPSAAQAAVAPITTVTVGTNPKDVIFSLDSKKAYVSNCDSDNVSLIDVASGLVTKTLNAGDCPSGMALSPDGTKLYIASQNSQYAVVINTETDLEMGSVFFGQSTNLLAISPDGRTIYGSNSIGQVYVAELHANGITVVGTPTTVTVFANFPITDLSLSPDGSKLYATNANQNNIGVIYTPSSPGSISYAAAFDSVVFASNSVAYFSTTGGTLGQTLNGGINASGYFGISGVDSSLALSADKTKIYAASRANKSVFVADLATKTQLASYSLGTEIPNEIAASPDGSVIYALGSKVSIISLLESRTISFGSTTSYTRPYGSTQSLSATVSAGAAEGTISYSKGTSTACDVNTTTGLVTMTAGTGTCVISASVSAGTTYGAATTTTNVTITPSKVALGLTASASSVAYGGTISPSFSLSSGAMINSDAISSVTYLYAGTGSTTYASSTSAPTNAGTYTVTPSAATFSTGSSSNYTLSYTPSTFSITKLSRTLSFSSPTTYEKSYGQLFVVEAIPTAGVGDGAVTYSAGSSTSCQVNSSTGEVRMMATTGTCEVSASIAEGTNYFAAPSTNQVVVNTSVMAITISANGASVNFGTNFIENSRVSSGSLAGSETITGATYTYEGINGTTYGPTTTKPTNAGVYSQTPSNVQLSGSTSNYSISYAQASGTVVISKVARTLNFASTTYTLEYGDEQTVIATASAGNGAVTYSAGSSSACTVDSLTGVITVTAGSGTCVISATITEGTNHLTAATASPVTVTVSPRRITVTAGSASVVVGNSFTATKAVTAGSLSGSDSISAVTYTYAGTGSTTYSASTTAPTAIGTYSVTPAVAVFSQGDASNYSIGYAGGTLTITSKLSRTLSFDTTAYALQFGDSQTVRATPSLGGTDGTVSYSAGSSTACSVNSVGLVNVTESSGTCEISATVSEGSTYLLASTSTQVTISVSTRAITLTADDLSVPSGGTVTPRSSITQGTLAGFDALSGATYIYAGTGSTNYAASPNVPNAAGTYSVTPITAVFSTGSASDYDVTFVPGTLTIGPQQSTSVSITLAAQLGAPVSNTTVHFSATGLSNSAGYDLILRSTPRTLASGTAVAGSLNGSVLLPSGLEAGWHTLTFTSSDAQGAAVTEVFYFKISSSGELLSTSETMPADFVATSLVKTGIVAIPYLGGFSLMMLVGAGLVLYSRRRQRRC